WNLPEIGMNFHSRNDVERLLRGWTVLELTEEDRPGKTKLGEDKHWHIFHIIARRMVFGSNASQRRMTKKGMRTAFRTSMTSSRPPNWAECPSLGCRLLRPTPRYRRGCERH